MMAGLKIRRVPHVSMPHDEFNSHLVKESAVIDVAAELRELVLQDLLELKTARLHKLVTRPAALCTQALDLRYLLHARSTIRITLQAIDYIPP